MISTTGLLIVTAFQALLASLVWLGANETDEPQTNPNPALTVVTWLRTFCWLWAVIMVIWLTCMAVIPRLFP